MPLFSKNSSSMFFTSPTVVPLTMATFFFYKAGLRGKLAAQRALLRSRASPSNGYSSACKCTSSFTGRF